MSTIVNHFNSFIIHSHLHMMMQHIYSTSFAVSFGVEYLQNFTLNLVPRFLNPVPEGICSLGYSQCYGLFQVFFLTASQRAAHFRTKITGTPMKRLPLVVSIVSLIFSFLSLPSAHRTFYVDCPEYAVTFLERFLARQAGTRPPQAHLPHCSHPPLHLQRSVAQKLAQSKVASSVV